MKGVFRRVSAPQRQLTDFSFCEVDKTDRSRNVAALTFHAAEVRSMAEGPLSEYLMRHMNLFSKLSQSQDIGLDVSAVTEAEPRTLLRVGVERYIKRHGLFATPEECAERALAIKEAGVDEIAHRLDFGVAYDRMLEHLEYIDRFRQLIAAAPAAALASAGAEL
jgi:hypothetical protein